MPTRRWPRSRSSDSTMGGKTGRTVKTTTRQPPALLSIVDPPYSRGARPRGEGPEEHHPDDRHPQRAADLLGRHQDAGCGPGIVAVDPGEDRPEQRRRARSRPESLDDADQREEEGGGGLAGAMDDDAPHHP